MSKKRNKKDLLDFAVIIEGTFVIAKAYSLEEAQSIIRKDAQFKGDFVILDEADLEGKCYIMPLVDLNQDVELERIGPTNPKDIN